MFWSYETDSKDIAIAVDGETEEIALQNLNSHTDGLVHNGEATELYDISNGGTLAIGFYESKRR